MFKEKDGKLFFEDYRVKNGMIEIVRNGRLKDLKEVYAISYGIGDLLGCFNGVDMDEADYRIVQYRGNTGANYALGI